MLARVRYLLGERPEAKGESERAREIERARERERGSCIRKQCPEGREVRRVELVA